MAELPLIPLLETGEGSYLCTDAEFLQLQAIADDALRIRAAKQLFITWQNAKIEENRIINESNKTNEVKRSEIIKQFTNHKDKITKLVSDILDDMDANSRKLVEKFVSVTTDEDDEVEIRYSLADALAEGNWYFLFVAAKETHIRRATGVDEFEALHRRETERQILKDLVHRKGLYTQWLTRFEDQLETCEIVGIELSEYEKCTYSMGTVNPLIFESTLVMWKNPLSRKSTFSDNYEGLKVTINGLYVTARNNNPGLVNRVEVDQREEPTLLLENG